MSPARRFLPVTLLPALLALVLAAGPLAAQRGGAVWETWSTFPAPWTDSLFGWSAAALGDVDGDGVSEVAVGAPWATAGTMDYAGAVAVFSGASGRLLWQVEGQGEPWSLGTKLAGPGDVDGDGIPDLAASATGFSLPGLVAGTVFLYSGRDGHLLRRLDYESLWSGNIGYGRALAAVGDLDGDGCGDLAVGAPDEESHGGMVFLRSGRTGQVLRILTMSDPRDPRFGTAIASPGDLTGDGVPEVAVGAPDASPVTGSNFGAVLLHDGDTGALLWRRSGISFDGLLGWALAPAGDVDGDGRGDVLAGAPEDPSAAGREAGLAYVLSGTDGHVLRRLECSAPGTDGLGMAVAGGKDLDGDGVPDLVVGAPRSRRPLVGREAGAVCVFSGAGGNLLRREESQLSGARLGNAVAVLGDANGDGLGDLLATATGPLDGQGSQGMILGLRPFLGPRERRIPVGGGTATWELVFGPRAAFWAYQVLASAGGTGPVLWQGLEVPLTPDSFFAASVAGRYPAWAPGFQGVLGPDGGGAVAFAPGPGDLPTALAGRDLYLAAVAGPVGLSPELVSLAATLHVEP